MFPTWHRYAYGVLAALLAVCTAIVAGAVTVPPALHDVAPYAGLVDVFLTTLLLYVRDNVQPTVPHG